ncbi:MAG: EpsI family protein [Candidatus Omnitrophica bacterium]|nr:EpsI family protein [Candidatus Omnitrophota bacterium]
MKRQYITIFLLLVTILICFGLPKPKYISPDILGKLNIPYSLSDWRSEDASDSINQRADDRYNFISDIFARVYGTRAGDSLLFIILDAGNFHHPKVCFGSSGYKIKELEDTRFDIPNGKFKAKTILALKGDAGFVLVYWMVINEKRVDWTEQKIKQLWFSLLNKEKQGLMMRLDIPVTEGNPKAAISLAQRFIKDISYKMSDKDQAYIFGRHE